MQQFTVNDKEMARAICVIDLCKAVSELNSAAIKMIEPSSTLSMRHVAGLVVINEDLHVSDGAVKAILTKGEYILFSKQQSPVKWSLITQPIPAKVEGCDNDMVSVVIDIKAMTV